MRQCHEIVVGLLEMVHFPRVWVQPFVHQQMHIILAQLQYSRTYQ
jgi:hypothetical protein